MSFGNSAFGKTSSDLLSRLRANEASAWERMADLYGPLVYYWCRRSGLHSEDASDVFQNVFSAVAKNIGKFEKREGQNFRGWLWTITRSKINDHFRRLKNHAAAAGGTNARLQMAEVADYEPDDDSDVSDRHELSALLHRGLDVVRDEFEDCTWQAFWRVTVDGHSTAEIAADMGISTGAVRQAKSRVLRRLKDEMGELPF